MVDRFALGLPRRVPRDCQVTLFREPRLLTGFPDLVAVTWHVPTAERWTGRRLALTTNDLRVVQLLMSGGASTTERLRNLLRRNPESSMERLAAAGLVWERSGQWRVRRLKESFAVRGIVAFEAKVSDWRRALAQAANNRWFATESYILLPTLPGSRALLAEAPHHGVGVWVQGESVPALPAPEQRAAQPLSFASWLLNEWSWRDAVHAGRLAAGSRACST